MTGVWPSLALTAASLPPGLPADDDFLGAPHGESGAWKAGLNEFSGLFGAVLVSELAGLGSDEPSWLPALPAPSKGPESSKPVLADAVAPHRSIAAPTQKPLSQATAAPAEEAESHLPAVGSQPLPTMLLPVAADMAAKTVGPPGYASAKEHAEHLPEAWSPKAPVPAQRLPEENPAGALASQPEAPLDRIEETAAKAAPAMAEARLEGEPWPARQETSAAREVRRSGRTSETLRDLLVAPQSAPEQPTLTPGAVAASTAPPPAPIGESVRSATESPELRARAGPRGPAPAGGDNAAHRQGSGKPHGLGTILPARELLQGEPVFALRISSSEPAFAGNGQPNGATTAPEAEGPVAMKTEASFIPEPAGDFRPVDIRPVLSGSEAGAVLTRRQAEGFQSAPGHAAEPPAERAEVRLPMVAAFGGALSAQLSGEAKPRETPQSRPRAPQPEAATPEQPSVRRITLQLEAASGGRVRLDVRDRAGEIHVAVSARGTALAASLREGAAQLVHSLQARGFAAELLGGTTAAIGSPGSGEGSARQETSPDSAPPASAWEQGSGGGHGGRRRPPQRTDGEALD